ncbi:cAMP-dependent protein kinase catalytic subunit 3 [Penicillium capsulatum]|uniref:cAMP-dependent protein kinase catalytic subunit 3 n=1 Tax=Penicillium capsulatum TaxID=69766 RepID=A0A9W9IVV6_9EURO|nr:cAMP-dependent protein kinase catalytic subunit 3 [Penicillium capsulatum]
MASGSVEPSVSNESQGTSTTSRIRMRAHTIHEKERHLKEAIRQPLRAANPFIVSGRQEEKELCISSRNLQVNDFKLIKTLGTGTFARVWLARLKDQDDKSAVYALKILRKADGEHTLMSRLLPGIDG